MEYKDKSLSELYSIRRNSIDENELALVNAEIKKRAVNAAHNMIDSILRAKNYSPPKPNGVSLDALK